ncbi:TPA: hypothetical protein ACXDAY_001162 [Clostridium botulinum]|uniref:hypothetical protein n=1 Tax=Clostridium botulinum TaxID=1491 RepID=UPI00035BA840|nr:hypothetical protein [Clostridium botulinum]EPS55261.1 hypothetical protein CLQ_07073 [Clostridium botulinum Af84]MBN3349017.1 hypothetical protein [Clostridium botulinum]MBN3356585.1 hypothetical protein [Clostridium botulinum]NFM81091.1 hypothetical protein [Clostridium botulinum]NFP10937.1 hypothetical protein [Clostridium botulinum]
MEIKSCGICDFKSDSINEIGLIDFKGQLTLKISYKTKIEDFNIILRKPLTTGLELYLTNEFLRSLNTGIDIKFQSFKQYDELLKNIANKLNIPYVGV